MSSFFVYHIVSVINFSFNKIFFRRTDVNQEAKSANIFYFSSRNYIGVDFLNKSVTSDEEKLFNKLLVVATTIALSVVAIIATMVLAALTYIALC